MDRWKAAGISGIDQIVSSFLYISQALETMPSSPRKDAASKQVEQRTQEIGQDVWARLNRRKPTVFERRWWLDHILEWAMHDESVKVQMFRFVDVLPTLKSSTSVAQHLQEYFDEVRSHLPAAVRMGLDVAQPDSILGKALAVNARTNARKMAERFIAGTTNDEIFRSISRLRKSSLAFTLDLLGEAVISEPEAETYQQSYLDLIEEIAPQVNTWPEDHVLDRDSNGFLPRCNVSLKLSALTSHFNPMDPEGTTRRVIERLQPILELAREQDAFVNIDMEHYSYKDLTLHIFEEIAGSDEFRDWPHFGIVVQAYLQDSGKDLKRLRDFAEKRGTPIWVRLVKGAYWDHETITSASRGWPCPVYQEKWQTDENFEIQTKYLFENTNWLRPAIASHNLRSLAHAMALAEHLQLPQNAWEMQMLYGMAEETQQIFSEQHYRVRVYTPFGEMLPGMSYLVRRLLENTSNESFLRSAHQSGVSIEELLRNPTEIGKLQPTEIAAG
ncbi:MAG TPA: proline dehydrogenase family protein [Planctomicrobium sp.]|nr:proline dehydrogenase family protein [Planctomicrobium sp.]